MAQELPYRAATTSGTGTISLSGQMPPYDSYPAAFIASGTQTIVLPVDSASAVTMTTIPGAIYPISIKSSTGTVTLLYKPGVS